MKNKIVLGILFGVLLLSNYRLLFLVDDMGEDVEQIENMVRILGEDMKNIETDVNRSVKRLIEEKRWLYNVEADIKSVSEDMKNARISVSWSIRELDKNASVYLLYGVLDEKSREVAEWKEVNVQDSDKLSYKVELDLPFMNNYEFKVLAKSDDRTISQKLDEINALDRLIDRMDIDPYEKRKTTSENHVILKFYVDVDNRYDLSHLGRGIEGVNEDLLKIKNVKVKIYSNDTLKEEIEIYKDGKIVDEENGEYNERFKSERDIKLERIEYSSTIEYDSVEDSYEVIEVIVEDYLGRSYVKKSRGM